MAASLVPSAALAQGLGGAARQASERREQVRSARGEAPCFTDDDLRAGPELADPASDPATVEEGQPGATSVDSTDHAQLREELDRARSRRAERERQWRQRFAKARARVAAARQEHDAVCHTGKVFVTGG
jgi:hypothetical protein